MRACPAVLLALLFGATFAWAEPAPAEACLYIPTLLENSVLFYESFESDTPDSNKLDAAVSRGNGERGAGIAGHGLRTPHSGKKSGGFSLGNLRLPLSRPLTVSMWWRLEEPMLAESNFHLLGLRGQGWISNFVRGKGQWCGLSRPTCVVQVYNWPNVSNWNGLVGKGTVEHGVWHHAAITVTAGSHVCVYWDGELRADYTIRGRLFGTEDAVASIDAGSNWLYHPMTIDDVLVLNRALSADEIADYIAAVRALAGREFPVRP